jgi:predicted dehydrogenase
MATASDNLSVRVAIAGMSHDHVNFILRRSPQSDIEIVGIAETNAAIVERYDERYGLDRALVYAELDAMLDETQPEVVTAYGSIYEHLQVVEVCAPRGIHVMVEKPLAVNMTHAQKMADLARQHQIHLLTNYETTWYSSNHALYRMVHEDNYIGPIRKIIVRDGHRGPQEIGASAEFLAWLTDPVQNGGGAVIDFGCYGANLATWLMGNQTPLSVTAEFQQTKPDLYPKVDDDATIILNYERCQAIVGGSWTWPIGRKDMEVYGSKGFVYALDRERICHQQIGDDVPQTETLPARPAPYHDAFAWLAAVVRGKLQIGPHDLSSLANNLIVVQILDTARESARSGQRVQLGA